MDCAAIAEIVFADGMVGWPRWRRFRLIADPDGGPMMALQSLDEEAISLLVAEPDVICPDYQPNLSPDDLAAVGLADVADARLYCVLTVRQSPLTITANLLGPIVVNPATGAAIQAVLTDTNYPTRYLLVGDERIPSPPAEPAALSERQRSRSLAAGRR